MTTSHITVVLPTRRRPKSLALVLQGLSRQHDPGLPWDVVVVDNDDPPGTASALAELASMPVATRVVHEPLPGASVARNRGMVEAAGDIVAFIDDDVVPADDWLAAVVEPILAGRCDGVGGRVDLDPSVTRPRWMTAWMVPYLADFHPADAEIDLRDLPEGTLNEPYLLTANAAFTAAILHKSGGFDPLLGPRAGVPFVNDDLALCRAVHAAGGVIHYSPVARVVHELPPQRLHRGYFVRRLYAQGRSDWMLDRERVGASRSAGIRTATIDFPREMGRLVRRRVMPQPWITFLWCEAARRAGYLREGVAHLARRRRPPTRSDA